MIKFDLRLKQETVDSIKELAEKESRSVSGMARKILQDYMDNLERNTIETQIYVDKHTLTIPIIKTDKNK